MASRKTSTVETAVIVKKSIGESNSQIAEDLGIHRQTVARILDSADFHQAVDYGKIRVHRIIPETCDALERAIESDKLPAILAVLHGTGILESEQKTIVAPVQVNLNVSIPPIDSEIQ